MNFQEKVQSMTAKEIILAMTDALKIPPIVNIDMQTYGIRRKPKHIFGWLFPKKCFGCAATNTVCKIANIKPIELLSGEGGRESRAKNLNTEWEFLTYFEQAINALRSKDIEDYNYYAFMGKFAKIIDKDIPLSHLNNNYTNEDLESYIKLANLQ